MISELLTPREAAKALKTSSGVLAIWRHKRTKPLAFVRKGRKIYYRPEDIQKYIELCIDPGIGEIPARFAKKPSPARKPTARVTPEEPSETPAPVAKKRKR
jgi:hypothetical protein